jgi:hypothetical protein
LTGLHTSFESEIGTKPNQTPRTGAKNPEIVPKDVRRNKKAQASAGATAALGILRKTVPDLSSQELKAEIGSYVARLPMVAPTAEAWLESVRTDERPLLKALEAAQQVDGSEPNG